VIDLDYEVEPRRVNASAPTSTQNPGKENQVNDTIIAPTDERSHTYVEPDGGLTDLRVRIEGKSPLLMHNLGPRAQQALIDRDNKVTKTGREPRDAQAEFEDALYLTDDGGYGFPSYGLKGAIVAASFRFGGEKNGMKAKGAIIMEPGDSNGYIPVVTPVAPRMRIDNVSLPTGKQVRYRPEFGVWSIEFSASLYTKVVTVDQFMHWLTLAGNLIGIGDWRPEKDGPFGRFAPAGMAV
jgi:hypothetical protein